MDPRLMVQAAFGGIGQGVPASVPQSSGGGESSIDDLIRNIATPIDPKLVSAATTPIPGSHTGQLPSSLQRPIGSAAQGNMIPTQGIVGKKYGKMVGIGNAIIGATNALSSVVTAEAQHKQDQVKDAATKVLTAQQGIDEAKQQHDAALENLKNATPGSPEAQQYQQQVTKFQGVIDQNTKTRDGVFADPKIRKALTKGFDISYVDPSSNNTEEHKAVQAAMKQAKTLAEKKQIMQEAQQKAASAAGEAYAKQQPQGLTMDAAAQQRLAIAQSNQKVQQEVLKDYLTFKASAMHANATVTAAQLREQGALMMKQAEFDQQQNMLNQRNTQAEKMLGEHYNDQLKLLYTRASLARQTAKNIFADKEADPLNIYNKTRLAAETYRKNLDANVKLYQDLQGQRQALYTDKNGKPLKTQPADSDVKALDYQIGLVHDSINLDKQNADNFTKQADMMQKTYGLAEGSNDGTGTDSTTGASHNESSDSAGEPDYADPLSYLSQ